MKKSRTALYFAKLVRFFELLLGNMLSFEISFPKQVQRLAERLVQSQKVELLARMPYLTMKHLIRQTHISEPRELVLKVLGVKVIVQALVK